MAGFLGSISVIVPTFNRSRKLMRLLDSLDRLQRASPMEIIIVDDCSTDDTDEVANEWLKKRHRFDVKYHRTRKNGGPAKARNLGLREALGDVVAFTDDDCVVHEQWLVNLVHALDVKNGVIGVGGTVLPVKADIISRYYTFHHILEPAPSLLYLVTANCCYLRASAIAAGGFDTNLPMPGGEDVALSFKLYKQGYRFALAKNAIVYHDYRRDLKDFYRTFLNYGMGCRYVTEKYYGNGGDVNDSGACW